MPPSLALTITLLFLSAAFGAISVYFFMALKFRHRTSEITLVKDAEAAVLQERLKTSETNLLEHKGQLTAINNVLAAKIENLNHLHGQYLVQNEQIKEFQNRARESRQQEQEKLEILTNARLEFSNALKAISSDIFKNNSEQFIHLAKETLTGVQEKSKGDLDKRSQAISELLKPIHTVMEKVDIQIQQVEKDRSAAYAGLSEQIQNMMLGHSQLKGETANLVNALRTPAIRGRWGEIQLKRVVEMAGMLAYCDFTTQKTVASGRGSIRPDLIIKLPNEKTIVVDSKAVLQAYIEAIEAKDEVTRQKHLRRHAEQIKTQLKNLAAKSYWDQFNESPEFVVLFLPGENFFSAALEQCPELIEFGVSQKVIIATPTTLIALLRAVSYGWRQEKITENAQKIGQLGKTLHERIGILTDHFNEIRKGLDRTILAYNNTVGSFENRVLVSARKFKELDPVITHEISNIESIDKTAREYTSQENSIQYPL